MEVALVPILLGGGIPLVPAPASRTRLILDDQRHYPKSGIMLLEHAVA